MVEAIKLGVPVAGQLDSISQTNTYNFNANRGDQLRAYIGGSIWPTVKLFDPNNRLVYEGSNKDSLTMTTKANLAGTYTLSVSNTLAESLGNYGLTVQTTNKPGNANTITFGSTVPNVIDNYEEDAYTFAGTANTKISIGVIGGIWPGVVLFAPDGSVIQEASGSDVVKSTATLTEDGTYTILVRDTSELNGIYDLTLNNLGKPKGLTIKGTSTANTSNGGYGYDTIYGLAGNDTLYGNHGNDRLLGGNGVDSLMGGSGEDILSSGKGNDILTGEQGKDQFLFNTGRKFQIGDTGIDTIKDFDNFSDKIILDKTTFTSLNSVAGDGFSVLSEFAVVNTDGAASTSKAEIVYNSTNGKLFYNPNSVASGYGEGGYFAVLTGFPALARGHFILQA